MKELANQIEAVLFSVGKKISVEELAKLCRAVPNQVLEALHELKKDYEARSSSLMFIQENNFWRLTVREQYAGLLQNLVAETELSRSILETLAVIAWKAPVLQSEIVRIRTSKSYDHIAELENTGFVTKERHGRSWLLKLTQKFFDYFALKTKEDVQNKFKELALEAEAAAPEQLGQLEVVDVKPEQKSLETYSVKEEPAKPAEKPQQSENKAEAKDPDKQADENDQA